MDPVSSPRMASVADTPAVATTPRKNKGMNQLQRGTESLLRSRRQECKVVLDNCDWVVQGTVEYLMPRGAMLPDGKPRELKIKDSPKKTKDGNSSAIVPAVSTHHTYTKPIAMPVKELRAWLKACEPSIFTDPNLDSISKKGNKKDTIEKFCEHLEHCTGMLPDETVCWYSSEDPTVYEKFLATLRRLTEAMQNPALGLILPIKQWATCPKAPYIVKQVDSSYFLCHSKSTKTIKLDGDILLKVSDLNHFTFDLAHSESRCTIRGPTQTMGDNCMAMFMGNIEDSSTRARQNLRAIADAPVDPVNVVGAASSSFKPLLMIQNGDAGTGSSPSVEAPAPMAPSVEAKRRALTSLEVADEQASESVTAAAKPETDQREAVATGARSSPMQKRRRCNAGESSLAPPPPKLSKPIAKAESDGEAEGDDTFEALGVMIE